MEINYDVIPYFSAILNQAYIKLDKKKTKKKLNFKF